MNKPANPARDSLTPAPVFDEEALQEAFRVSKIHDDDTRCLIRCAVLAYEVAKKPNHRGKRRGGA